MASLTPEMITRVRTIIRDLADPTGSAVPPGCATFDDSVYLEAGQFSLEKLSYDFDEEYLVATDVPYRRQFLLQKLATIQMAQVRASSSASGEDDTEGAVSSISVPDLSISEDTGSAAGADYWLQLAAALQEEYDNEIAGFSHGSTPGDMTHLPTVLNQTTGRFSLRSNSRAPYNIDVALAAPTVAATVDGSDVVITWSPILDQHFAWYEIYRSLSPTTLETPSQTQRIEIIPDPHGYFDEGIIRPRYVDKSLASGTYQYRMCSVNDNTLRGFSSILTVVVP